MEPIHPTCHRCGGPNGRRHRWCGDCMRAYRRGIYARLSPDARAREIARATARVNKARGRLVPEPCADCGAEATQMHHADHSRPLDVTWLCLVCHRARHT